MYVSNLGDLYHARGNENREQIQRGFAGDGRSFWGTLRYIWDHAIIIHGPLWFVQALLMFSLAYRAWRAVLGAPIADSERKATIVPGFLRWLLAAVTVGAISIAIRQFVHTGKNVIGLTIGYFAPYICSLQSVLLHGDTIGCDSLNGRTCVRG